MQLSKISKGRVILFDGAMGTMLEASGISCVCNEEACLSNPKIVKDIHLAYLNAGADIITTNTFGASRIVLAEYGLAKKTAEINRAAVLLARKAAEKFQTGSKPRFVAGEIGPTSKLPTLGNITFDEMFSAYAEQAETLIAAGADIILIATCQDILQTKAAAAAVRFAMENSGKNIPLFVSVTVEKTGTMLLGTEIMAAISTLAPYEPRAFGINCALGPDAMEETLSNLSHNSPFPIICRPNAGVPENVGGRPVYPLGALKFADILGEFTKKFRLAFVGGCCGTTPEHIKALAKYTSRVARRASRVERQTSCVSSLYKPVELDQVPRPFIIAEQLNVNGSKKFREFLLSNDYNAMAEEGRKAALASHALDICVAYAGRDECKDMTEVVRRLALKSGAALMIDSTNPDTIEAALKLIPGRPIINSINLEDGGKKAERILKIAKRFGAAVVALTIDENGMAKKTEEKLAIVKRLAALADEEGLHPDDILIDPLTFTLASGDNSLRDAAVETMKAIRAIKKEIKGARTILGVSNISFGLAPPVRKILTSVFLHRALAAGLDAAIINPAKITPLHTIPKSDISLCERLIENDHSHGDPLQKMIENYRVAEKTHTTGRKKSSASGNEDILRSFILNGTAEGIEKIIGEILNKKEPAYVINKILLPAMRDVGKLFGDGKLPLPFVLGSAEAMRAAFDIISPKLRGNTAARGKLILATVRGDVHDIGKNLVDIILSNNGFEVVNLGIRQPAEAIIEAAVKHKADAIGLSGLLVSSTEVMKEDLEVFRHNNLKIPVFCGGAALTKTFVDRVLAKSYGGDVRYCKDAFDGLNAMQSICGKDVIPAPPLAGQE